MYSIRMAAIVVVASTCMADAAMSAMRMNNAFTYQGQLKNGGVPINGPCDLRFSLWDDPVLADHANQIGTTITFEGLAAITMNNGLFSVELDFGPGAFGGDARWLEISLRYPAGTGLYATLSPRQEITPAPYALMAQKTMGIDGHSLDSADGSPVDALFVDEAGQVGIGTDRPGAMLDVQGIIRSMTGGFEFPDGTVQTTAQLAGPAGPPGLACWDLNRDGECNRETEDKNRDDRCDALDCQGPAGLPCWDLDGDGQCNLEREDVNRDQLCDARDCQGPEGPEGPQGPVGPQGPAGDDGMSCWDLNQDGRCDPETEDVDGDRLCTVADCNAGMGFWLPGERGEIYYNGGNVGVGTNRPASDLDVRGTARVDGFRLPTGAVEGHVLTTDAAGTGTWQAPPAGSESLWQSNGADIYYADGLVGIGTSTPTHQLTIEGPGFDKLRLIKSTSPNGEGGRINFGDANYCYIQEDQNDTLLIHTVGRVNFDLGYVGFGVPNPDARVHVNGKVHTSYLRVGNSATSGDVLTADSLGNATWQPPPSGGGGDFTLPVDETVDVDGSAAFQITNTGGPIGTSAIRGVIDNATSSDTSAGSFRAIGAGQALTATADNGYALYATSDATAVYGSSSGTGGGYFRSSMNGGYGVRGRATSTGTSSNNWGGWFEALGSNGRAVYANATGAYGRAIEAIAEGGEGTGVWAEAPWNGIVAKAYNAAKLYGDLRVYTYGTNTQVFHVNDSTGVTSVDVLEIVGGSDLSEQFDIEDSRSEVEPGTVVCIDPANAGKLIECQKAYDRTVAGIVSGAGGVETGMRMGQKGSLADGAYPVALTGRVYVMADATSGPIEPGDLLTTSDVPGRAMKVSDYDKAHGATLGKAMTSLKDGQGLVLVLVSLQ